MGRHSGIKTVEARLRASLEYGRWAKRNLTGRCLRCDKATGLQVHHVVDLYHLMLGLWKLYGDWELVLSHAMALHDDDRVEAVTLCEECHGKLHPLRGSISNVPFRTGTWTVFPRVLNLRFAPGNKNREPDTVGLVTLQVLMGLGWHILNGDSESRIMQANRRRFAELLGKKPGTSFNSSLKKALSCLADRGILLAYIIIDNEMEVHFSPEYVERLGENPWFFSTRDMHTSSMTTLCLRLLLSFHASKKKVSYGIEKLAARLGLSTTKRSFVIKAVERACKETPWATMEARGGVLDFRMTRRGAVPIRSLRKALGEVLEGN